MRDYLSIGSTPSNEDCAQVGSDNYSSIAKQECRKYIDIIRQKCGNEPDGANLSIKSFPHDFGSYYEVVCYYNNDIPESVDYAYFVESNSPVTWDDIQPVSKEKTSILDKYKK
ncbi:MAG: hypothetical protein AABY32_01715 [Nanoarchaeota archaeon]